MNEDLKHIFDQSACLTRRQVIDYADGSMNREEVHVIEHHLIGCPLCNTAVDAVLGNKQALPALESLNTVFLKEHFHLLTPEIHFNSLAPAQAMSQKKTKKKVHPLWYFGAAAAGAAALWYLKARGSF